MKSIQYWLEQAKGPLQTWKIRTACPRVGPRRAKRAGWEACIQTDSRMINLRAPCPLGFSKYTWLEKEIQARMAMICPHKARSKWISDFSSLDYTAVPSVRVLQISWDQYYGYIAASSRKMKRLLKESTPKPESAENFSKKKRHCEKAVHLMHLSPGNSPKSISPASGIDRSNSFRHDGEPKARKIQFA
jgi:hypothetical protein